jgi:hypothetical protein
MKVAEAITKLHDFRTSKELALYLKDHGIRGGISRPNDNYFVKCPIDVLIESWTGEEVSTGLSQVSAFNEGTLYDLPLSVVAFNYEFNSGKYPELIAQFPRELTENL